jgi:hypothetical protein
MMKLEARSWPCWVAQCRACVSFSFQMLSLVLLVSLSTIVSWSVAFAARWCVWLLAWFGVFDIHGSLLGVPVVCCCLLSDVISLFVRRSEAFSSQ